MSIVVTATFVPHPGKREELLAALEEVIPLVHAEEGCELYSIQEREDGLILMIEKWESAELLDAHGEGAPVVAFRGRLEGLLAEPVVVTRYEPIPVGDPGKGAL